MTTQIKPAVGYEKSKAHFENVVRLYQPEGAYTPDRSIKYTIVRRSHYLGSGTSQPYLAIKAVSRVDGRQLYTKPCSVIRWDDGSTSVWWYGGKSKIFAIDNVNLPK
jgi:hypothetical protein